MDARIYDPKTECMTHEERNDYYNTKLGQQLEYVYRNSKTFRTRLDAVNVKPTDIRTVKDLEKIPVISKDELIDLRNSNPPWGGILGVRREKIPKIFMSPGPIYEPMAIPDDIGLYRRFEKIFYAGGFRAGDIAVNTWSYHMVPAGHWFDEGLRRLGVTVIPMGVSNTELQARVLFDMPVTGWLGSAAFLLNILKVATEIGYNPKRDYSLRSIFAGGESGGGPIRKILQEEYGFATFDAYGTADVGSIAFECGCDSGMHILEEVLVEIVDPLTGKQLGPGEIGEVVVTPFVMTYPLLRFGTGDLSYFVDDACPCGRTSSRLPRVMGRIGEAVKARGLFIHPRQVGDLCQRFSQISRAQVVIGRKDLRDDVTLRVELIDEEVNKASISSEISFKFQDIFRVRLDSVEFVGKGTIAEGGKTVIDIRDQ